MAESDRVLSDTLHWFERAVIGLNLCPFAKAVHVKKLIRWQVCEAINEDELLTRLEAELAHLAGSEPARLDTTVLIHPQVLQDFWEYQQFLKRAQRKIRALDLQGVIQLASFHPQYEFSDAPAGDVTHYTNRSPFPMLHLLREDSVSRAVAAVSHPDSIYEANRASLRRLGLAGLHEHLNKPEGL